MKRLILCFLFLSLLGDGARAGVILGTSNPSGMPLVMSAGTTSGPMFVNVISNNPPNDIMSGWNITLEISPVSGASGTLTFKDPATESPSNPPNYIFGGDGLGIFAANGGTTLIASDLFTGTTGGSVVLGTPGANLLQMDFLATSNASGLFGVYAVEGKAATEWTDGNSNPQLFTNVPDTTGMVLIGEILIPQSVPEPSSLVLLGLGGAAMAGWQWQRKRSAARRPRWGEGN